MVHQAPRVGIDPGELLHSKLYHFQQICQDPVFWYFTQFDRFRQDEGLYKISDASTHFQTRPKTYFRLVGEAPEKLPINHDRSLSRPS